MKKFNILLILCVGIVVQQIYAVTMDFMFPLQQLQQFTPIPSFQVKIPIQNTNITPVQKPTNKPVAFKIKVSSPIDENLINQYMQEHQDVLVKDFNAKPSMNILFQKSNKSKLEMLDEYSGSAHKNI